jgi:hypothetical protein
VAAVGTWPTSSKSFAKKSEASKELSPTVSSDGSAGPSTSSPDCRSSSGSGEKCGDGPVNGCATEVGAEDALSKLTCARHPTP